MAEDLIRYVATISATSRQALRSFVAALAAILLGASTAGSASAITSNAFTYPGPHTGFYTIDPMELVREANDPPNSLGKSGVTSVPPTNGCFSTGVHLPQGALIKTVLFAWNSQVGDEISIEMFWTNVLGASNGRVFPLYTSSRVGQRTLTFAVPTGPANPINNAQNSHSFRVCLYGGALFRGARITYSFTNAGD